MKATEARLLDFLKRSQQFVIPIYQRTYSWTEQQCRQLWDDIIRAGKRDDISAHLSVRLFILSRGCIRFLVFLRYWSLMVNNG
ncbi:TPA: GmrSD restriction endonuclease domain-containing protein [Escherichia coli]|uniref:GmrSD restriction endonuclease domain-containing protein n=1 Tax=Escherichia coli TaxID=562 RepID=UPI003D9C71B6